jgi:hypothetical protein
MATRPLLFGYIRLREPNDETDLSAERQRLRAYAVAEGCTLAEILVEHDRSGTSAFARLVELLKQHSDSNAVVTSLTHFAELTGLQAAMRQLIERETGALVLVVPCDAGRGALHAS